MGEVQVDLVTSTPEPKKKKKENNMTSDTPDVTTEIETVDLVQQCSSTVEGPKNKKERQKRGKRKNKNKAKKIGGASLGIDIGGFTVIGDADQFKKAPVARVLPEWLLNPSVVSCNLKDTNAPVENFGLDADLVKLLNKNVIPYFFPVQQQVLPWILEHHLPKLFRPSDICVSAPTGSGKTLAYALPIIQILKSSMCSSVRAIIVLPTEVLASQVFQVFQTYCKGTDIKSFLMTNRTTMSSESRRLITFDNEGTPKCFYDVIIATPGRLIDHMEQTDGFNINNLRFLVVDEADRTLDDQEGDWLHRLEIKFWSNYKTGVAQPWKSLPLNVKTMSFHMLAFQKLLFSATLSQNPETLEKLHLFQPKLFTSIVDKSMGAPNSEQAQSNESTPAISDSFIGKFTTPKELKESFVLCQKETKPLILTYLIKKHQWKRVLCFANTNESTHRLCMLLNYMGDLQVREITSKWSARARELVIKKFIDGGIDILVTSDQLARGVDISLVDYVVSYDVPGYTKTYIHRIGRTARAGREGHAISLVTNEQMGTFKRTIKSAGKPLVEKLNVKNSDLRPYEEKFKQALVQLKTKVEEEDASSKNNRHKRKLPSTTPGVPNEVVENTAVPEKDTAATVESTEEPEKPKKKKKKSNITAE